jgi:hypothetical protein
MSETISCFRCGASLSALSLPLSRRDQCPDCSVDLHVCKMCVHFDSAIARQCREDGAEDVTEKERVNFCDWFKPSSRAFDPSRKSQADAAQAALASLFGEGDPNDN